MLSILVALSLTRIILLFDSEETQGVLESPGKFRGTEQYSYDVEGNHYMGISGSFPSVKRYGEPIAITYSPSFPFVSKISESPDSFFVDLVFFFVLFTSGIILFLKWKDRRRRTSEEESRGADAKDKDS